MRRNVASQVIGAQMVSASDGSAFTGSVTCLVTIDGGTQATGTVGSGACNHEGNGYHTYTPSQAETNGALVAFTFTGTGAVPVTVQVFTTGYDYGAANLPANVTQFGGSSGTFSSGRPEVNTTHIAGSAVNTSSAQLGVNVVNAGGTAWATVITNLVSSIWSATTRLLTAGTNIVLAKGTGVTGFNDLSAAQVNAEADAALADYDGPTNAEMVARTLAAADYATAADLATVSGAVGTPVDQGSGATLAGNATDLFTLFEGRTVARLVDAGEVEDDAGNSASSFQTSLDETADDHWVDAYILFTASAALGGQVRRVVGYTASSGVIQVASPFTEAPSAGDQFAIINR